MNNNAIVNEITNVFCNTPLDDFPCSNITEIYNYFCKKYGCQISGLLAVYIFGMFLSKSKADGKVDGQIDGYKIFLKQKIDFRKQNLE